MLVVALMSLMLMTALGSALVLTTVTEMTIAGNYQEGTEAFYAAEAAVEWAMQDLRLAADWSAVTLRAPYVDAPLDDLLPPGMVRSRIRVVVELTRPAATEGEQGLDVLRITGHAYAAGGGHRAVEVTVARPAAAGPGPVRVMSWRELP